MMYNYQETRKKLFTSEMMNKFIWFYDQVKKMLNFSGAVTQKKALERIDLPNKEMRNCFLDRLVELELLKDVTQFKNLSENRVFILNPDYQKKEKERLKKNLLSNNKINDEEFQDQEEYAYRMMSGKVITNEDIKYQSE